MTAWSRDWIRQVGPAAKSLPAHFDGDQDDKNLKESFFERGYRQLNRREKAKLFIFEVTTNYFGGDQAWDVIFTTQNDHDWLPQYILKANPRGFGDLCRYRGALAADVTGNLHGVFEPAPVVDPHGSGIEISLRNTFVSSRDVPDGGNVFRMYGQAEAAGEEYWINRMLPPRPCDGCGSISLEEYYGEQYAKYDRTQRLCLATLLLFDPAFDVRAKSKLNEEMKGDAGALRAFVNLPAAHRIFRTFFRPGDILRAKKFEHNYRILTGSKSPVSK